MGSKALYFIALVVTLCAITTISHATSIDDNTLISSLTSAPIFTEDVSPEDAAKDTLTIPMATAPAPAVEPSLVAMSSTYGIKSFRKGPYATKWPWLAFGAEGSDDDEYPYYYRFADGTWVKVLSRWRYIEKEPHPRAKNILTEEARMFQIKKERLRLKNKRLGFGDDDPDEDEEAYEDYDPNDRGVLVEPTNEKVDRKDLKAALHHPDPLVKKLAKWHRKVARHQKKILKLTRKNRGLRIRNNKGANRAAKQRRKMRMKRLKKHRKGRKSKKSKRKSKKSKRKSKRSKKSKKRGVLSRLSKFARKSAKKVGKAARKMFRGKTKSRKHRKSRKARKSRKSKKSKKSRKNRKARKSRKARKHSKKARKHTRKSRKHGKKSRKGRKHSKRSKKSKKSSKKLKKSVKKAFKKALKKPLKAFKKAVKAASSVQPGRGFKPKRGPPPPAPFVPMTDASYLKHLNQAYLPDDLPEFHIDDHPSALAPQFDRIRRDMIGIHNRVEYARDMYQ